MPAARPLILLTPPGRGGVAVLAMRGSDRWDRARDLLRGFAGEPLEAAVGPRRATLWVGGRPLDEVLVVDRPRLAQLEIHTHGSPAVLATVEAHLGRCERERPSAAQELMWRAQGDAQLALALEQLAAPLEPLLAEPLAALAELRAALARSRPAMALARPARLVLCGAKNAGKSTLMNRLLYQERVLTGSTPGLTRDPVHAATLLDGYPYLLVDTAGEGPAADDLDRRAQDRGRWERRLGLRLLVVDGSHGPGALEQQLMGPDTLVVCNKRDLPQATRSWPAALAPWVAVSCLDSAQASLVREVVGEALRSLRELPPAGPVGGPAALDASQLQGLDEALARAGGASPTALG